MKVGIVGTGAMGRKHAACWLQLGVEIGGFVARRPVSAEKAASDFGGHPFATLAEMLPAVDVVDVCSPTHLHCEQVVAAARAGKHVICEKPLARTLDEAQGMLAACATADVKLLVAHVVRYFEAYADAKRQVADGAVGALTELTLARLGERPAADWFHDVPMAGGMLLDLMIHDYDVARWLAGDVTTVHVVQQGETVGGIDNAVVRLTHRSGVVSTVRGSWTAQRFRTRFEIVGESGSINYDSAETSAQPARDPYLTQLDEFYRHLLAGDTPLTVDAVDGLQALAIGLAALRSAASGQPIYV